MTTFVDGPAKGKTLMLKRAVRMLRVTECDGKFDALDQLEDKPRPNEKLYCYTIVSAPGWSHVRRKGGGGFYPIATYKLFEPQPTDEEMRTNWAEWCRKLEKAA